MLLRSVQTYFQQNGNLFLSQELNKIALTTHSFYSKYSHGLKTISSPVTPYGSPRHVFSFGLRQLSTEYQLHDSLKKELQDLGVTKIPSSNKIQKRIENLESEQAATVREKQEMQKKQKTLDIIRQNFTALLSAPEMQIPVSGKKPTL